MLLAKGVKILYDYWVVAVALVVAGWLLRNKYGYGISKFPGPVIAAWTNWWRLFVVWGRKGHQRHYDLAEEYGDVVRIGPNYLLFNNPKAIQDIYGFKKLFWKTAFYEVSSATAKGHVVPSLFSTTDERYHSRYRRCVSNAFAMSTLVSYEPLVNSSITAFLEQTHKRFIAGTVGDEAGKGCNFPQWLQYFAFDALGEIAWSKRLGFVDRNEDVDGIINSVHKFVQYTSVAGQMPWLDYMFLDKNPLKIFLERRGFWKTSSGAAEFAVSRARERSEQLAKIKAREISEEEREDEEKDFLADLEKGTDFLSRFTRAQALHPEFMSDFQVLAGSISLIFAGSPTTSTTLSALFYELLRHPHAMHKLRAEIESLESSGLISRDDPVVSWPASQKMPYLDAVITEIFRMYPAIALPPERYVPPGGATILGHFVPEGTIVGCNSYVVNRYKPLYGKDADTFRPERWLDDTPEKIREMKNNLFHFGAGKRTCLGRHITTLEIYKLIPSFLRKFDIEFVDPAQEWKLINGWFVKVENFFVKFKERRVGDGGMSN